MRISGIDHFVLTVRDVEATCDFYSRVLGMEVAVFKGGRRALKFGRQKINLHQSGKEFEPNADKPAPGSSDFCLIANVFLGGVVDHVRSWGSRSWKDQSREPGQWAGSGQFTFEILTATSSRSPTIPSRVMSRKLNIPWTGIGVEHLALICEEGASEPMEL